MSLILRPITPQDSQQVMAYRAEFLRHGDSMDGTANLSSCAVFEDWYAAVLDNRSEKTVRPGLVPATTLLAMDDGLLVGMIDIRHRLNDYLAQFGGHIGYSVRASQRRKGYATQMLTLGLGECRKLGLDRVLITCYKDNAPSAKTIQRNGGILENEVSEDGKAVQRYWIQL